MSDVHVASRPVAAASAASAADLTARCGNMMYCSPRAVYTREYDESLSSAAGCEIVTKTLRFSFKIIHCEVVSRVLVFARMLCTATATALASPPAFTPADERKLKQGIEQYGRQWHTIQKRLFTRSDRVSHSLSLIRTKGLALIKVTPAAKSRLVSAKASIHKIEACSFDRLVRKFGVLVLKAVSEDYDATQISPSEAVDEVWHAHILDTRHYRETCTLLCGEFIDHDPDGGSDEEARQVRRDYLEELKVELGSLLDAITVMPEEGPAPAREGNPSAVVSIKLVNQDGNEVFFQMKRTTPFDKLMVAFCQRQGICINSVRFLFNGARLTPELTPNDCFVLRNGVRSVMQNVMVVDVMVEQIGC
jgi:small ubiquitin-related modifier